MKITFTCEKCGHIFSEEIYSNEWIHNFGEKRLREKTEDLIHRASNGCPNCTERVYGPLTEKMVAKALANSCSHVLKEGETDFKYMARFVLRLMEKWDSRSEVWARDWPAILRDLVDQEWESK